MSTLYTGKGDGGTTKFFGCDQKRVSKSSSVAEALGNLDELNSFLGLVKLKAGEFAPMLEKIQENIFILSAHIAGAAPFAHRERTALADFGGLAPFHQIVSF